MMPPRHASLSSSGGHDCQAYPAGKLGETDRLFLICLSSRNLAQETLRCPMKDRFLKRLRKKAKKGMRGWPAATIAFYGPDSNRASKVVVGIIASENAEVGEMCDWKLDVGDVRNDGV